MRIVSFPASFRSTLLVLATVAAASSLVACTGDDTNPAVPDAGTVADAASDAAKATDGAAATDTGTATDAGTATDDAGTTDSGGATDAGTDAG